MIVKLAAIFFSMILVNNYVLVKFLGICPFLGVSKKLDSALGMSGAVIFVMFMSTLVTFPIQIFVLDPAGLGYLQTIVFILVIAVLVQFIEMFLKKYVVSLYNALGVYLPLITTNCCVLGRHHPGHRRLRRRCGHPGLCPRLHRGAGVRGGLRRGLYAGHVPVQRRAQACGSVRRAQAP